MNKLTQVTVVPLGLGAPTTLELKRIVTNLGMSDSVWKGRGEEIPIFIASFDWLWPQICGGNARIDGIKIDVQGMEIDVVRGMSTWLKAWKPKLAVEVHAGVDREALLTLLESCGYRKDATPLEPIEGETSAQYVNDRSYAFRAA
jgi:hypothetical protein